MNFENHSITIEQPIHIKNDIPSSYFYRLQQQEDLLDNFQENSSLQTMLTNMKKQVHSDTDKILLSYIQDNLNENSEFSYNSMKVTDGKLHLLDPLSGNYIHLEDGYSESNTGDYNYLKNPENIINDGNHVFLRAIHSLVDSLQGKQSPYPFEDFLFGQITLTQEEIDEYCEQFTKNNQEILDVLHIDGLPDFCIPLGINNNGEFTEKDIIYFVNFKHYKKAVQWNNSPNSFRPQFSIV